MAWELIFQSLEIDENISKRTIYDITIYFAEDLVFIFNKT